MNKVYCLLPLTLLVVSCASTTPVEKTKIDYLDLSAKEQANLVDAYWTVTKRVEPQYPISAAKNNISGCVDLIVGIDQSGKARGYKVHSSYPEGLFDKNAAAALVKWQWQATEKNKGNTPILTSIQMDFMTSRNPTDAGYLENCPKRDVSKSLSS
ncbi:energy transducer TonB [Pseudoalteromonas tunicata]|uniref:energy transducer TonB n=1 Tax=Pseudoalteromonas tunicata TaxID=314281 RepID=UPI00273F44A1|nr:energy transducer TonB [Pseudoalteromonas tunicata]MDP5214492.1 energy transducer TonB [Pseudoalteromonas tunicata]